MSTEVESGKMLDNAPGQTFEPTQNGQAPLDGRINAQLESPILTVEESTQKVNNDSNDKKSAVIPPQLPHVEINQVPLSMIIRNLTIYTIKEISQYMKTNLHSDGESNSSNKKVNFLQLIIFLRNQFLKLYVLIKWARTIKKNNFNTMIDLLNWFRTTNMSVNNCIWALKNNLTSMANAKLPNVDLVTALEVLSLGRPNLPTHNFILSGENNELKQINGILEIPPNLILQRLRDLNLTVSIKYALMDVPEQFNEYKIADGRIYISVKDEFEVQLSTTDRHSPLFFVDLNLLFNTEQSLPLNKFKLEKLINEILLKSNKPLFTLYQFLHKYVLTLQLYMVHVELLSLENNGKFSGGNLVHAYDSKKSIISGRYWINGKMGNKGKFTIGLDRSRENLILRWDNDVANKSKGMPVIYTSLLKNLENILDEIMFNHSRIIRAELLSKGIFMEDEENHDVLLFQIPTTCLSTAPVQLKIDLITGVFYFRNPTPLLLEYTKQINRAEKTEDLTKILQKLKLDKITHILRNMFEKTGWVCSKAVSLETPIPTQLNIKKMEETDSDQIMQKDLFICLRKWPVNWYLILTIISSNSSCIIEKRIGKVVSEKGKWQLKYLDHSSATSSKLETITYQKIMSLQKSILHRIVNHMLIDSLNQLKIKNKVCTNDVISNMLPKYIYSDAIQSGNIEVKREDKILDEYTSIITLELESFLEGSKALNGILESSMFMRIDYTKSEIRLYSKFKRDTMIKQVQCDDLLIYFVAGDSLAFYLVENFTSLSNIVKYLTTFKQKLMQLVILTDVVERLHKNFGSEYFVITALKPNEISFKYIENSTDTQDCTINIITSEQMVKNLTVQIPESNPQHIIQPFINQGNMDYHFIFNYLQFTSSLFVTFKRIIDERKQTQGSFTTVSLGLHNLSEYQLVYHNPESATKITLIIELKKVSHSGKTKIQFYVHFANEEHITPKSLAYPMLHQVSNQIFMLDTKQLPSGKSKYPNAVRLIDGISCNAEDIEPILMEIHDILKVDSNVANNDTQNINI